MTRNLSSLERTLIIVDLPIPGLPTSTRRRCLLLDEPLVALFLMDASNQSLTSRTFLGATQRSEEQDGTNLSTHIVLDDDSSGVLSRCRLLGRGFVSNEEDGVDDDPFVVLVNVEGHESRAGGRRVCCFDLWLMFSVRVDSRSFYA